MANIKKFKFRGSEYEVNVDAARSVKVQRGLSRISEFGYAGPVWEAMDALFCGRADKYIDVIPGDDGKPREFGCTNEDLNAFVLAAAEVSNAKN